jgi:hypothetical protein
MPTLSIPNDASIHTARAFLTRNQPFGNTDPPATLELHPTWAHMDPLALALTAAWGGWCQRHGLQVEVKNLGRHADYAARMRLFQHLVVDYNPPIVEHEEAGRFLPVSRVADRQQLKAVIADISALLHLDDEPDGLAAVQYCVSELLRNVLEHSGSPEGAYVCAHRYVRKLKRVTIAVADCGQGVAQHLSGAYAEAGESDMAALGLAMQPGITGARSGMYGTPENAGAGLFITRSIAKGTGGYFLMLSGSAAYRLCRTPDPDEQIILYSDAFDEPRHNAWELPSPWQGTAVAVEIRTDRIPDFQGFFQWIRRQLPQRESAGRRVRFT